MGSRSIISVFALYKTVVPALIESRTILLGANKLVNIGFVEYIETVGIKENSFVSSHVVVSGYCEIGENCFIGVNSSIADFKKIAKDSLIGAGSIIIKDTKEGKIYRSAPSVETKINVYKYFGIKE